MFLCSDCHGKSGCYLPHSASSGPCEVCRTITATLDCHRPVPEAPKAHALAFCTDCHIVHADAERFSESAAKSYEDMIKRWHPNAQMPSESDGSFWATCGGCKAVDEERDSDDSFPGVRIFRYVQIFGTPR